MKDICIALVVFLVLVMCSKEETDVRPYPRVRTQAVSNITGQGALLHAEITFTPSVIVDHGFIWSTQKSLTLKSSDKISLGSKPGKGSFETTIDRSLAQGVRYYVKAYARSNDYLVYGDVVEFVSLGSMAPVIEKFSPVVGNWGDTVIIVGHNFSDIRQNVSVKFGTVPSTILYNTPDTVRVIVPQNIVPDKYKIYVDLQGNSSASSNLFEVIQPMPDINMVSNDTVVVGDQLTISGENFNSNFNVVKLNNTPLPSSSIFNSKPSSIQIKIPAGIPNGEVQISVSVLDKTVLAAKPIIKQRHKITSVEPLKAFYGDVITIKGNYFSKDKNFIKVLFDGTPAEIVSVEKRALTVRVPNGISTSPSIVVKIEDVTEQFTGFTIAGPVINSVDPYQHLYIGDIVTVYGDNFGGYMKATIGGVEQDVYSVTRNSLKVRIVYSKSKEANLTLSNGEQVVTWAVPLSFQLTTYLDKTFDPFYSGAYFSTGTKAYFGFGQYNGLWDGFVMYDPSLNSSSWVSIGSVPKRYDVISFYLNGTGFVGSGGTYSETFTDLWAFDPSTNRWSVKADIPLKAKAVGWFTADTKAYCLFYDPMGVSSQNPVYEYDAPTNTWTKKKDFPGAARNVINDWDPRHIQFFKYNGKYFMLGGVREDQSKINELWSYDPATDEWSEIPLSIQLGYSFLVIESRDRIFLMNAENSDGQNWYEFNSDFSFTFRRTTLRLIPENSFTVTVNNTGFIFSALSNSLLEFDPNY